LKKWQSRREEDQSKEAEEELASNPKMTKRDEK